MNFIDFSPKLDYISGRDTEPMLHKELGLLMV